MAANNFIKGNRSIKSRVEWLLENPMMSDLNFIVGEENQEFPAHKFMFGVSSNEFYNGFYAMTPEDNIIRLPEINVDAFKEFLRYIYTEEANVIADNILDIMKLGLRYEIDHLIVFCYESTANFIFDELQLVGALLKIGISCKDQSLIFHFLAIISKDPLKYLTLAEVGYLSRDHLKLILEEVDTNATEGQLFNFAVMWAKKFLSDTDPVKIRNVLGDLILLIRFPTMSLSEFEECVSENDGVLESKDVVDVILFIGDNKRICKYPVNKRKEDEEEDSEDEEEDSGEEEEEETINDSTTLVKTYNFHQACYSSLHETYLSFAVKADCKLAGLYFISNDKISSVFGILFELTINGLSSQGDQKIETTNFIYNSSNNSTSKELLGKSIRVFEVPLTRKIFLQKVDTYKIKIVCKSIDNKKLINTMLRLKKYSNEMVRLIRSDDNNLSPIAGLTLEKV